LWVLSRHGRLRFNELHNLVGPVTAKVLTQRLRQLERDGLIARTYHAEIPPRVEYETTDLGRTLSPVFAILVSWSEDHLPAVHQARQRYDTAGNPLPA
jgi:DNA-binding HxlR family transcriptional regulator